jgi:hypothetical protein
VTCTPAGLAALVNPSHLLLPVCPHSLTHSLTHLLIPSLTHSLTQAPDTPTVVDIEFEKGDPVAINGRRMSPASILTELNKVRGEAGRLQGRASLVCREACSAGLGGHRA